MCSDIHTYLTMSHFLNCREHEMVMVSSDGTPTIQLDNVTLSALQQSVGEEDDGKRVHRCGFCEKAFKKSSHLKQHIRSHTG